MNPLKRVFILAYNCPHRKTFDVLTGLKALGYKDITVFVSPMTYKKKFSPLLQHRPAEVYLIGTQELCKHLGFDVIFLENLQDLNRFIVEIGNAPVLVAGAGLIPEGLLDEITFINAHPGYIPYARGLDAFKWSIIQNLPIGVTSHILGHEIDAGEIIDRVRIIPADGDTFHSLAYRVYQQEIKMLIESVEKYKNIQSVKSALTEFPVHRRMPNDVEKKIDITLKSYHCDEDLYNSWE